jgi:TolB-like protein/Flp pilus assembly protein TadD
VTDATEGEKDNIWDRMRRRKVVQWGIAYAAGAWGFLQGLAYVSTLLNWPAQLQKLTGLALLIGLPVVLVLAWFHGDRGHRRVTRSELAILTLLFLLGGGLFWRYQHVSETAAPVATAANSAPATALPAAVASSNDKSIAVLPFVDMSAEKNQEYMSDGMAEELLHLLAQVPDLKVIARTSSFAFKGKDVDIAEIAEKLNVAHVLEGSVRKSGNEIRVTAQLIRTADSTHLWSETYDRPLDDIFAVQDEIAHSIAQALQIKLMGGTLSSREGGTRNLEAYQLYLRAVSANFQNTRSSLNAAGEYLEQAIKLDPNYGLAWSQLSEISHNKADQGLVDVTEGYERSRQAAQRAVQLSPALAEAHARLQYVHLAFDWDWVAAEAEGRRALTITTTDPEVLNTAGILSYVLGRWDNAERQIRAALVRDPLNTYAMWNLGFTYYGAGRFADSEGVYRKLLAIQPDFVWGNNYLGLTLLAQGKAEEALAVVQQQVDDGERLKLLPIVLWAAGRQAESDEALNAQIARWANTGAFYVAMSYAHRGDHDNAIQWLERAYQQKDTWLATTITGEQLFKGMADDPRYKAFLRKLNLPESPEPAPHLKNRDTPS